MRRSTSRTHRVAIVAATTAAVLTACAGPGPSSVEAVDAADGETEDGEPRTAELPQRPDVDDDPSEVEADVDDAAEADADAAEPLDGATEHEIRVDDADGFVFVPDDLTVAVGDTVTWTHVGQVPHTVTGSGLSSGTLQTGQTFTATFDEVGVSDYICYLHGGMTGRVTVE